VLTATGYGMPSADADSPQIREFTALEAARQRALAGLAELAYGAYMERVSRVKDMRFAGETVEAAVSGQVKGAHVVSSSYDIETGLAEVTVRGDVEPPEADGPQ